MKSVMIDTGPLVAGINRNDRFHEWALHEIENVSSPLLTSEPVLTEAFYLLRNCPGGATALLELMRRDILKIAFKVDEHLAALGKLMTKYTDVPMSLADASLVRMSELYTQSAILTLDGDFRVYRRFGRQSIPLIISER
jgi:uncharacterized protein